MTRRGPIYGPMQLLAECGRKRVMCLYALVSASDSRIQQALGRQNFGLKDVRVTLRHTDLISVGVSDNSVRVAKQTDLR